MALYIVEADCISCGDCEPVCLPTHHRRFYVFKIDKKNLHRMRGGF